MVLDVGQLFDVRLGLLKFVLMQREWQDERRKVKGRFIDLNMFQALGCGRPGPLPHAFGVNLNVFTGQWEEGAEKLQEKDNSPDGWRKEGEEREIGSRWCWEWRSVCRMQSNSSLKSNRRGDARSGAILAYLSTAPERLSLDITTWTTEPILPHRTGQGPHYIAFLHPLSCPADTHFPSFLKCVCWRHAH